MNKRLYNLDLLRFVAALAVLLFHYTFRGYMGDHLSPLHFPVLGSFCKYGYLGVDLFFIISGFVIFMTAHDSTLKAFVASRISRLYPAYWAAVSLTSAIIILAGVAPFAVTFKQYLINMTMLNGFLKIENVDGVYWSLLIELKFYIFIGMILFFDKMDFIKPIMMGWLLLSFIVLFIPHHSSIYKAVNTIFITEWSGYFIAGMVFYMIRQSGLTYDKGLLLIATLFLSVCTSLTRMEATQAAYATIFSKEILIGIIVLFYVVFFLISIGRLDLPHRKIFVQLGALTYPLYLIHQFIGYILFHHLAAYNKYAVLIAVITLMLLISYLINRWLERKLGPLLRQKILDIKFGS